METLRSRYVTTLAFRHCRFDNFVPRWRILFSAFIDTFFDGSQDTLKHYSDHRRYLVTTHLVRRRQTRLCWKIQRVRPFRACAGFSITREYPLQSRCSSIDYELPHRRKYSIYTTTLEKWVNILALAQKWGFNQVEELCVRELQKMSIPSVDKIHIYQAFRLDRTLLAESFVDLTIRPDPLNLEEANKLGIETTLQITRARELSRGSDSGTRPSNIQLNGSELRSVIQKAFDLEQEVFEDFFVGDSFSL